MKNVKKIGICLLGLIIFSSCDKEENGYCRSEDGSICEANVSKETCAKYDADQREDLSWTFTEGEDLICPPPNLDGL